MKKPILEVQRTLRGHPIPQTASAESFLSEQRPALSLASNNATIEQPPSAQSDVPSIRSTVSSKSIMLPYEKVLAAELEKTRKQLESRK